MTITIIFIILTFFFMEGVAWFMHKYVMHGFLWYFHEDHHKPNQEHFFEKNDFFFLIFAIPSIILCYLGTYYPNLYYLLGIGLGITVYGFAYFMVHDVFIHQRFKLLTRTDNIYFRAIRKAHKVHHKKMGKEDGECFGMLWVPISYFKEAWKSGKKK